MFDFFKKKQEGNRTSNTEENIVLCIPVFWETSEELIGEIITNNQGKYIFAGQVLMDLETKKVFRCEVCDRDSRMKKSFEVAGKVNNLTSDYLEEIDNHKLVVYLSGKSGTFESAYSIVSAAKAILNSGGIGVKVETAGKAFSAEQWVSFSSEFDKVKLYELLVVETIYDEKTEMIYSCGMHNIGYKDVAVVGEAFDAAYELIRMFNIFRFIDEPIINENETFSLSIDSDRFRISDMRNPPTKGAGMFENQFGFWELIKIEE